MGQQPISGKEQSPSARTKLPDHLKDEGGDDRDSAHRSGDDRRSLSKEGSLKSTVPGTVELGKEEDRKSKKRKKHPALGRENSKTSLKPKGGGELVSQCPSYSLSVKVTPRERRKSYGKQASQTYDSRLEA